MGGIDTLTQPRYAQVNGDEWVYRVRWVYWERPALPGSWRGENEVKVAGMAVRHHT